MVLLKGVDPRGFRFFTNHESSKGGQLAASGLAALVDLLARARPPGPRPRRGRAPRRRGVRRLLRHPAPRLAARRLGLAAVTADGLADRARPASRRGRGAVRRGRGPAPGALGRVSASSPRRSSSGRAGSDGCTTASATPAIARSGGSSGSRRRAPGARRGRCRGRTRAARRRRRSAARPAAPACDARTLTPWPKASSSASSARSIAACRSGWTTTFGLGVASAAFARRSVSRTDQPAATASRARRRRTSLPLAIRIARPCPSLSAPSESSSSTSSGRSRSRIRFEIAGRVRPRRPASSSFESPSSSTSVAQARASSTGFRSSRATFSISAVCIRCAASSSRTIAGTVSSPASRAARQRRSPAISS